jgi:hypothetical protein
MAVVTKYSFTKQVNVTDLREEIEADASMTIMIDHFSASATAVDIYFKDVLPTAQETQLGVIVTAHTYIDPGVEIDISPVLITEETVPTGGHFQSTTIKAISGTAETWAYIDYSWPFPISFLSAEFNVEAALAGDKLDVQVFPDTVIGAITSAVAVDDTVINVGSTVTDNLDVGYFVTLTDGVNTESHGNRVIAIDEIAGTITLENGVANAYSAASPTYVRMTVDVIHDMELSTGRFTVGESKIGASYLPANAVLRVRYYNGNGNANPKSLVGIFDYLY